MGNADSIEHDENVIEVRRVTDHQSNVFAA